MAESAAGPPALGSVTTPEGLRRSARLIEKLKDPETAYDATLEDATGSAAGGGGKKRGGDKSETRKAVEELFTSIDSGKKETTKRLDAAIANLVRATPYALGTAAAVKAVQNISVFGKIVSLLRESVATALVTMSTGRSYQTLINEALMALKEAGAIGKDLVAIASKSPETAVLVGAILMSYRAMSSGKSVTQVIKDDVSAIASGVSTVASKVPAAASAAYSSAAFGVTNEFQKFNDAWEQEAKKKAIDTLREIGKNVQAPGGEGAAAMGVSARGAPLMAAQAVPSDMGGPGEAYMGQVPGSRKRRPADALAPLTSMPALVPGAMDEGDAAKAMLRMSTDEPDAKRAKTGGGRRRKTKKRAMKKRRVTRRTMPTFSY
jgi:hypothetical protein